MKNKWLLYAVAALLIVIIAVASLSAFIGLNSDSSSSERETLFQAAIWNNFIAGNYSGFMPYSELAKHGDFGIGTVDGLDGEMICVDGVFYQIATDGTPKQIDPSVKAPYATVTYFDADQTLTVAGLNYTSLKSYIDGSLTNKDAIYAIKITGNFEYVQARSPAKQYLPYPILSIALQNQAVWTFSNVSATAVGFWFPNSMAGVDYTGYHMHIITDDKTAGGHILDCIISNATVQIDQTNKYTLVLP
jgi:acetolactate decarboxylase